MADASACIKQAPDAVTQGAPYHPAPGVWRAPAGRLPAVVFLFKLCEGNPNVPAVAYGPRQLGEPEPWHLRKVGGGAMWDAGVGMPNALDALWKQGHMGLLQVFPVTSSDAKARDAIWRWCIRKLHHQYIVPVRATAVDARIDAASDGAMPLVVVIHGEAHWGQLPWFQRADALGKVIRCTQQARKQSAFAQWAFNTTFFDAADVDRVIGTARAALERSNEGSEAKPPAVGSNRKDMHDMTAHVPADVVEAAAEAAGAPADAVNEAAHNAVDVLPADAVDDAAEMPPDAVDEAAQHAADVPAEAGDEAEHESANAPLAATSTAEEQIATLKRKLEEVTAKLEEATAKLRCVHAISDALFPSKYSVRQ